MQKSIEVLSYAFEQKMEDWEDQPGPAYKKHEEKMKIWEEKLEEYQQS